MPSGSKRYRAAADALLFLLAAGTAAVFLSAGDVAWRINSFKLFTFSLSTLAAAGVYAIAAVRPAEIRPHHYRIPVPYAVFLAYSALTLAWASGAYRAGVYMAEMALILVFMLLLTRALSEGGIRRVFDYLSALTALLSLIGLAEYFGLIDFQSGLGHGRRMISTFGNPNYFTGLLVLLVPAAAAAFFGALPGRASVLHAGSFILGTVSLAFAQTRGAWIGTFAGLAIFAVLALTALRPFRRLREMDGETKERLLRYLLITAGVLIITLALVVIIRPDVIARALTLDPTNRSIEAIAGTRVPIYRGAVSAWLADGFLETLFGHGSGTFMPLMQVHTPPDFRFVSTERGVTHAHNEYLEILVEQGIFGLILWLGVVGIAIGNGIMALGGTGTNRERKLYAAVLIGMIAGALVHGMVGLALRTVSVRIAFYGSIIMLGVNRGSAGPSRTDTRRIRRNERVVRIAVLALAALSFVPVLRFFRSERLIVKAVESAQTGGFYGEDGAAALLDRAVDVSPGGVEGLMVGVSMFGPGEPARAYRYATEIGTIVPSYHEVDYIRGVLALELGRLDDAVTSLERYTVLDPFFTDAYISLAAAAVLRGDTDTGADAMERFFVAYHGYRAARGAPRYADTSIVIVDDSINSFAERVHRVSRPQIAQSVQAVGASGASSAQAVTMLSFYAGTIFDGAGYPDAAAVYLVRGTRDLRADSAPVRFALERIETYYRETGRELEAADAAGDSATAEEAIRTLLGYLDSMRRIDGTIDTDRERILLEERFESLGK